MTTTMTDTETKDEELKLLAEMGAACEALNDAWANFDDEARVRIRAYLLSRYGIDIDPQEGPSDAE